MRPVLSLPGTLAFGEHADVHARKLLGLVDRPRGWRLTGFDGRIGATSWSWCQPDGVDYGDTTGRERRVIGVPSSVAPNVASYIKSRHRARDAQPWCCANLEALGGGVPVPPPSVRFQARHSTPGENSGWPQHPLGIQQPTGSFRREQCYSGGPQVFIVCAAGYVQRLDASSTSAAPKPPKYECADDWHDEEDHGIDDDRHIFHRGLGAQVPCRSSHDDFSRGWAPGWRRRQELLRKDYRVQRRKRMPQQSRGHHAPAHQ